MASRADPQYSRGPRGQVGKTQDWTGVRRLPKGLDSLRATLATPQGVSDTHAPGSGSREGVVVGTRVSRRVLTLPEGAPTPPLAHLPCGNEAFDLSKEARNLEL